METCKHKVIDGIWVDGVCGAIVAFLSWWWMLPFHTAPKRTRAEGLWTEHEGGLPPIRLSKETSAWRCNAGRWQKGRGSEKKVRARSVRGSKQL